MKGDIIMSQKEIQRVRVMEQVISGALKLIEATEYLGISYRQAKRLKVKYWKSGPVGIIHGNRGRVPSNALEESTRDLVLQLSEDEYVDFNDRIVTPDIDAKFVPRMAVNPKYFGKLQATKLLLWNRLGEISKRLNTRVRKRFVNMKKKNLPTFFLNKY